MNAMLPDYQEACTSFKSFWTISQLKAKRIAILDQIYNDQDIEQNFRQTWSSYENNVSDPLLNQAYQEYKNEYHRITSLYLSDKRNYLFIYDTENEREEMRKMEIRSDFYEQSSIIAHLPNGDLFCFRNGISLIINKDNRVRVLPSAGYFSIWISAVYFKRNVYCFFEEYDEEFEKESDYDMRYMPSCRFDLDENRWIPLTKIPLYETLGNSIVFNGNIITSGRVNRNLLIYSIDLDSFSTVPYEFKEKKVKILAVAKERLYLIEFDYGLVYESGVGDEYAWQRVAKSNINCHPLKIDWLYNKGKIYISFINYKNIRGYLKFDLDKKTLICIACYSKHAALGIIDSKLKAIECCDQTFKLDPDHAAVYINNELTLYYIVSHLEKIEACNKKRITDYIQKGILMKKLGRNLEAVECFNESIKLNPSRIDNYFLKEML